MKTRLFFVVFMIISFACFTYAYSIQNDSFTMDEKCNITLNEYPVSDYETFSGVKFADARLSAFSSGKIKRNKIVSKVENAVVTTDVAKYAKKIMFRQLGRMNGNASGIAGTSFSVIVPDELDLYLPVFSGAKYTKSSPEMKKEFWYPVDWEAQFAIIQGKDKGYIIYADDDAQYFKRLHVSHEKGKFILGFETDLQAPFKDKTSILTCKWNILEYSGNWLAGAKIYADYAGKKFNMAKLKELQPKWVDDIEFIITAHYFENTGALENLARVIDPKKTIVYLSSWRTDDYDKNYPNYVARDVIAENIKKIKAMGYRVMLHTNVFGVSYNNPLFERFGKYQLHEAFYNFPFEWEAKEKGGFGYINIASKEWRDYYVSLMTDLCKKYDVDCLYMDQTQFIMNNGGGLADGLNNMQGSIELHKAMRAAMPDVALAGEGCNEISFRYQSFAQRHPASIDFMQNPMTSKDIEIASPVSSAVFSMNTRNVGHLSMPRLYEPEQLKKWLYVYENYGYIPTYPMTGLEDPNTHFKEMHDYIIKQAQLFQKYELYPCFDPALWDNDTVMVYKTKTNELMKIKNINGKRIMQINGVAIE